MNLANKLSFMRILMIPVYLVFLLDTPLAQNEVALAIFVVASLTDFLDGYIARKYNMITKLGKLLDPLADKLLTAAAFIAFTASGLISPWIVVAIIARELTISVFRAVAAADGTVIAASYLGKIKTNLQMTTIIVIHLGVRFAFFEEAYITDILAWTTMVITLASAFDYIWKNKRVLRG